jgi:hypothetical protein
MDILLGLLTIDELNNVIVLETFHDGDFTLEVLEEFTREFGPDDRFDSNDSAFTLQKEVSP